MRRRYRILGIVAIVLLVLAGAAAIALSHNVACGPTPALVAQAETMTAAVNRCYGPPSVVRVERIARPALADDRLLVHVYAASVNPLDWHFLRGEPYVMRLQAGLGLPANPRLGVDYAGVVVAVGSKVTRFRPGDAVMGGRRGSFAEYISVAEEGAIARKPDSVSFADAAAAPIAAVTALQALRDKAGVRKGQKVLIVGASGGVGTYALQIAKNLGAEVTGVCSTTSMALVRSLGADHVIDYTSEDYADGAQRYDAIIDMVSSHSPGENRQLLRPGGTLVIVGAADRGAWLGPLAVPLRAMVLSWFVDDRMLFLMSDLGDSDLATIGQMLQSGALRSVIDRHYPLAAVAQALEYVERGHAHGKVIVDIANDGQVAP